ncbi:MAG: NAD(P)-dependent glycerol-3-phosphate dehydrogenase [Alphaproteobacteria bacterium]|nr:NAD(P)-dependent glycerol-3-phosphate dehydrogenase [Alphaproteobacteria bacterium]
MSKVSVIGGGAWGTALAETATRAGHAVDLVVRDTGIAAAINSGHVNAVHLPGDRLSPSIRARADHRGLVDADFVLVAVPAQTTRQILSVIGPAPLAGRPVVLCAKGLETATLARQSEVLTQCAPEALPLVLSGPSFAHDVASGRPTAVTLAARDDALCARIAAALSGPTFRLYQSHDLVGVELAGALKNVYALAAGAVEGAQLGLSARSAVISRAYAEMSRLVTALGGEALTLTGLAGLGDLTLSCTSPQSRNYAFGIALGTGLSVAEIEAAGIGLAEGVKTAPVALGLGHKHGVDTPLIGAVNALLAGELGIGEIVAQLMARPLKREGGT